MSHFLPYFLGLSHCWFNNERLWGGVRSQEGFKMVLGDVFPFENSIFCGGWLGSERKWGGGNMFIQCCKTELKLLLYQYLYFLFPKSGFSLSFPIFTLLLSLDCFSMWDLFI